MPGQSSTPRTLRMNWGRMSCNLVAINLETECGYGLVVASSGTEDLGPFENRGGGEWSEYPRFGFHDRESGAILYFLVGNRYLNMVLVVEVKLSARPMTGRYSCVNLCQQRFESKPSNLGQGPKVLLLG